ncbi:hypothetical protein FQR65_LT11623 [Abscondita terminalis]|nr:hypothetical protein FQR65_LT11623 [Abscondita terminalis]
MNSAEFDTSKFKSSTNEDSAVITQGVLYEEEKIHFPPSTELIADEYEHKEPTKGVVLIFHSKFDVKNKDVLVETLSKHNYAANVFSLSKKQDVLNQLSTVSKDNHENTTCLMVFFLGTVDKNNKFFLDDDSDNKILLKEVWSSFTGHNCPQLISKPKLFIFQASKRVRTMTFDAVDFEVPPDGAYNIPSEADMLLVYKKVDNPINRDVFFKELCMKIDQFGKRDDFITLITRTTIREKRPIIISTLTRKFYLKFNEQRDHFYDIHINHGVILQMLKDAPKKSIESGRKSYSMQTDSSRAKTSTPPEKTNPVATTPKTTNSKLLTASGSKMVTKTPAAQDRPRWK